MKLPAFFLALLTVALPVAAARDDLVNCVYSSTGLPIAPKVCNLLRQRDAEEEPERVEAAKRREAYAAERVERDRARDLAVQAANERAAKASVQAAEERAQEAANQAERARQADIEAKAAAKAWAAADAERREAGDKALREIEAADQQHERRMAMLQRECGADFQAPRVGMTLARAKRCVGDLKLYGQNGTVSAYRAGSLVVRVVDGKLTKWVILQRP